MKFFVGTDIVSDGYRTIGKRESLHTAPWGSRPDCKENTKFPQIQPRKWIRKEKKNPNSMKENVAARNLKIERQT